MWAIITVINKAYLPLLEDWANLVRRHVPGPICVIGVTRDVVEAAQALGRWTKALSWAVATSRVPFAPDSPEKAASCKINVFEDLPSSVDTVLLLDVDTVVLADLHVLPMWLASARAGKLVACLDYFVGYKERLAEEMEILDGTFRPVFIGEQMKYINTGVLVLSREHFQRRLAFVMSDWIRYMRLAGHHPSILDQNILNYHLIKHDWPLEIISRRYNCLRTDEPEIKDGTLWIDGQQVAIYHLNGGSCELKLLRRDVFLESLRTGKSGSQSCRNENRSTD